MGWINGYPDGSFRPDATITRAEMMAMINRALGRTPQSADDLLPGMKVWSDNANVSAWYMTLLNCIMLCICSFLLTEGLEQAGTQSSLLRVVDTCVNQAADILNLPAMDISGAEFTPERHDLRAEDIRFSYGEKPIINGITLDIPERTSTAIVGPENEKELMDAITELTQEKTVIMIAHRLKTVRHAAQILVVDKGQIVQRGTHEALMAQGGIYRRFITGREQAVSRKL